MPLKYLQVHVEMLKLMLTSLNDKLIKNIFFNVPQIVSFTKKLHS